MKNLEMTVEGTMLTIKVDLLQCDYSESRGQNVHSDSRAKTQKLQL